jgi:hypothetical protein
MESNVHAAPKAPPRRETIAIGTMQGAPPGGYISAVGVLDLRGVSADQVAAIESVIEVKIIILDEENRQSLRPAHLSAVGSIVVAGPDERVIAWAQLDISNASLEKMPPAQKLVLLGNIFLKPDVNPELAAEKIERLQVVGTLICTDGVQGMLIGRLRLANGVCIVLPDNVGPVVRCLGQTTITTGYLHALEDNTTYVNIGRTEVEDAPPELVRQKILVYHNAGETAGPRNLLASIRARCATDLGKFHELTPE